MNRMRVTEMDFTNRRFGRLVAISSFWDGKKKWICRCDCGNETKSRAHDLYNGTSTSCGCLNKERRLLGVTKHGLSTKRPYFTWQGMIARCYKKNCRGYERYGGRGITVCDRWRTSFQNFWDDMHEGYADHLQIDRLDNDGPYCKENCKWSTRTEQQSKRSCTVLVSAFGKTQTVPAWSRDLGINQNTIRARIDKGWTSEDAVSLPKRRSGQFWKEGSRCKPMS